MGDQAATMTVRMARRADTLRIAALSREEIESGLGWRWHAGRVAAAIIDTQTNVVVAEYKKNFAGFGIMRYGSDSAHLLLFAVDPTVRRQGIGSAIWAWLEKTVLVAGLGAVNLEVRVANVAAKRFYESLGFAETEALHGYYRGRESALRMQWVPPLKRTSD